MRTQAEAVLYGLELKEGGEYEGRKYEASAVFHLDAALADSQSKKTYGITTRPFKADRAAGDKLAHLGASLPIRGVAIFDLLATAGKDQAGVQLRLVEFRPAQQAPKA